MTITPERLEEIKARAARSTVTRVDVLDLIAEVKRLREENANLASWQCIHTDGKTGLFHDEWGNSHCAKDAQQWQPIETAPRDGTKVLTYWWDRGVRSGDQVEAYFNKKTKRWETEMTVAQADYHPTHWMPRPKPPVQS